MERVPVLVTRPRRSSRSRSRSRSSSPPAARRGPRRGPPRAAKAVGTWCNLSQQETREFMAYYGFNDIGTGDLATRSNPNAPCERLTALFPAKCMRDRVLVKKLGSGSFGHVYEFMDSQGNRGAVKFIASDNIKAVQAEVAMHKKLARIGVAPGFIGACYTVGINTLSRQAVADMRRRLGHHDPRDGRTIGGAALRQARARYVNIIFMEKIDHTVEATLRHKQPRAVMMKIIVAILAIIDKLKRANMTHGDLHFENMAWMTVPGGKSELRFIDTGFTADGEHYPELDFYQMVRTAHPRFSNAHPDNLAFLRRAFRTLAWKRYGLRIPTHPDDVEDGYWRLHGRYKRRHGM